MLKYFVTQKTIIFRKGGKMKQVDSRYVVRKAFVEVAIITSITEKQRQKNVFLSVFLNLLLFSMLFQMFQENLESKNFTKLLKNYQTVNQIISKHNISLNDNEKNIVSEILCSDFFTTKDGCTGKFHKNNGKRDEGLRGKEQEKITQKNSRVFC